MAFVRYMVCCLVHWGWPNHSNVCSFMQCLRCMYLMLKSSAIRQAKSWLIGSGLISVPRLSFRCVSPKDFCDGTTTCASGWDEQDCGKFHSPPCIYIRLCQLTAYTALQTLTENYLNPMRAERVEDVTFCP